VNSAAPDARGVSQAGRNAAARDFRGYFYIAIATFCWAVAAVLARAIFGGRLFARAHVGAIGPLVLSQTRTSISFLLLAPTLLLARRAAPSLQTAKLITPDALGAMLIGAAGIACSNFCYYVAIQKTTVATAIVLQYLCPIWVLLFMIATRRQPATAVRISAVILAVLGSALVVGIGRADLRYNTIGILAGLAASFAFAFYNVRGRSLLERYDRWSVFLYAMLGATVFWCVVNPPWRLVSANYSAEQWEFLLGFAIASVLVPYAFYFSGLRHLDATRAVVTSCLEPVFAILLAAIALGEILHIGQAFGVACVIAATVMIARSKD